MSVIVSTWRLALGTVRYSLVASACGLRLIRVEGRARVSRDRFVAAVLHRSNGGQRTGSSTARQFECQRDVSKPRPKLTIAVFSREAANRLVPRVVELRLAGSK
jgi:hypothetical protein